MPVCLTKEEIEKFHNNGIDEDNIRETVYTYRAEGLDDNAIRAKVDKKLSEFKNVPVIQGNVSYDNILENANLSREQKVQQISERGNTYREGLDEEHKNEVVPLIKGGVTKMLAPATSLIPVVGIPLAGSIYGIGQGIEDRDNLAGIAGKAALYGGASYLGGAIGGKTAGSLPVVKNQVLNSLISNGVKGASVGGFDGLSEGIKEGINKKAIDIPELAKYTLGGMAVGGALSGAVAPLSFLPSKSALPSTPTLSSLTSLIESPVKTVSHSEFETTRQLIRDAISAKRALTESQQLDVSSEINKFIAQTKNLGNHLNISDKNLRELMPFLRENTDLPKELQRTDLHDIWNKLQSGEKGLLTSIANDISAKMEKHWDEYSKARGGVGKYDETSYITHLWDINGIDVQKLSNYLKTSSKSEIRRVIDTYAKGIQGIDLPNGDVMKLTPKTLDYAEILQQHANDVINSTNNTHFTKWLNNIKLSDGTKLIDGYKKGYKMLEHLSFPKNTYVHPKVFDTLNTVFEKPTPKTKLGNVYDTVNNFAKTCKFLLNAMHGVALTESSAAHEGLLPLKTLKTLFNVPKIIDGIKNNNYELFKNTRLAKLAINDGVQFGNITDIDIEGFTTGLDDVLGLINKVSYGKIKPITASVRKVVDINSRVLWNYLHNTYKLHTYDLLIKRFQKQSKSPLSNEVRKEIGQVINDTFGGQNWDTLGIKPSTLQTARRVLLSPDWNMSAFIRHSLAVFSSAPGQKILNKFAEKSEFGSIVREFSRKIGFSAITNDVDSATVRGKIARQFFYRFIIQSSIYANLINAANRGADRIKNPELYETPTQNFSVYDNNRYTEGDNKLTKLTDTMYPRPFVGRDKNGREKYARISKQARETPEFIEDGTDSVLQKTASKTSPLISPIATKVIDEFTDGWNKDTIPQRYKDTFTPFSFSASEFSPTNAFYASTKGVNYYNAAEYVEKNLAKGNIGAIEEFLPKLKMNKIDKVKVIKSASRKLMINAMMNNDTDAISTIWKDCDNLGIDAHKVYKSAIYGYLELNK